jgi:hypothetical protein
VNEVNARVKSEEEVVVERKNPNRWRSKPPLPSVLIGKGKAVGDCQVRSDSVHAKAIHHRVPRDRAGRDGEGATAFSLIHFISFCFSFKCGMIGTTDAYVKKGYRCGNICSRVQ